MNAIANRTVSGMLALSVLTMVAAPARSGEADVVDASARRQADGTWTFSVTVAHADEGWDHYANRWDIIGPDGTVYGERVLLHPHVGEQPFTRSLSGVAVPDGIARVTIRANDSVHATGGKELDIDLPFD